MSTENLVPNLSDCVVDSENKTGGIGLREIHVWQLSTQSATTVLDPGQKKCRPNSLFIWYLVGCWRRKCILVTKPGNDGLGTTIRFLNVPESSGWVTVTRPELLILRFPLVNWLYRFFNMVLFPPVRFCSGFCPTSINLTNFEITGSFFWPMQGIGCLLL